jgi:hypothetical protein
MCITEFYEESIRKPKNESPGKGNECTSKGYSTLEQTFLKKAAEENVNS